VCESERAIAERVKEKARDRHTEREREREREREVVEFEGKIASSVN
jgi:hypothetical protein